MASSGCEPDEPAADFANGLSLHWPSICEMSIMLSRLGMVMKASPVAHLGLRRWLLLIAGIDRLLPSAACRQSAGKCGNTGHAKRHGQTWRSSADDQKTRRGPGRVMERMRILTEP